MTSNEEFIRKNKVIIVDDDKNTKLHYAAAVGNVEEVEKIIATRQKLDPQNYLGWTPLMMAIRNGHSAIVDLLLERGADTTKKNKFGMNVFLISVTYGDVKTVQKILDHLLCGGVSRQSLQREFSPISMAILFGQNQVFKYLLDRAFDPNVATPLTGITPMMFAAAMGNYKVIKKLIQQKADPNSRNHLGRTAQDISQTRHQRIDIGNPPSKQKPQNLPLIFISPHNNSPQLQLTPYPSPHLMNVPHQPVRKSSNTHTPTVVCTPGITPITPQIVPHMFFGPNFTPSQFISPVAPICHSNTFLNATISPSTAYVSPIPPQQMCLPNYV